METKGTNQEMDRSVLLNTVPSYRDLQPACQAWELSQDLNKHDHR